MRNINLTDYDVKPQEMINYIRYYGMHFNSKLLKFACDQMKKGGSKIVPFTKQQVDDLLDKYNVKLENNQLLDYVFVANMAKADFLNSSIVDDEHLAKYIKDVIDDDDAYDGIVFNRWYADMSFKGIVINWEEIL